MFELVSPYSPAGDQPQAIAKLTEGLVAGAKHQVLLGVTGSGKTFTVANVIRNVNRPTLVISHNKTLAAQLYAEFKGFFPNNAVEYFVSYFDYYQPEAYIPRTDTFIEKDSSINEEIERLRLSTMSALFSRRDVIVVASVSCIYGIGSKEDYEAMVINIRTGMEMTRDHFLRRLVDLQYTRNDIEFTRGQFRVRGDTVELCPAGREDALRVEFFGDEIERITRFEPLTGHKIGGAGRGDDLPRQTIRHARREAAAGAAGDSRGTGGADRVVREGRQAARGPAHQDAHRVRPGDDGGDGLLLRHRELLAASGRPPARLSALHAVRFLPARTTCW